MTMAAANPQMNYQGKLTTPSGVSVPDGTYNMRFWLLTSPSVATSSAVLTESLTSTEKVQVTNGLFSIMLGSSTPLTSVDFNQTLYLGVEIGGTSTPAWDGEMSPRKILGTVPAAFVARTAEDAFLLGGVASTSFLRSDQADTMAATSTGSLLTLVQNGAGAVARFFSGATEVFTILNNGNVGIGTSTPAYPLEVVGTGQAFGAVQNGGSGQQIFTISRINHGTQNNIWGYNISNGGGALTSGSLSISPNTGATTTDLSFSGVAGGFTTGGQLTIRGATGNVGIGSTTPSSRLTVAGNTFLGGNVTATGTLAVTGATTLGSTLNVTGVTTLTNASSTALTVSGGLFDGAASVGTSGMVLQTTGTSTRWTATSSLGFASAFTTSAQLAALLGDETGTGNVVFSASPTFTGTSDVR